MTSCRITRANRSAGSTQRIKAAALVILESYPEGLQYSQLHFKILAAASNFNPNTVHRCLCDLVSSFPDTVYKPAKGLFRLLKYRLQESEPLELFPAAVVTHRSVSEDVFYQPFADYLKNDLEDVSFSIPLGGNIFKDRWGTPDVIGKREAGRRDLIKGPTEIVSAEIKVDSAQLITAFGQACAYKLFSHKVYLVVPRKPNSDEISRLDSLCQIFGIGLVTFNCENSTNPDFRILVRPTRHEPDLFYTNKYLCRIEKLLFPQ